MVKIILNNPYYSKDIISDTTIEQVNRDLLNYRDCFINCIIIKDTEDIIHSISPKNLADIEVIEIKED